ncbi:MAG TPA: DUF4203 domain-containing protein [Vicinamibacterales bacterium]|nr:DUF4203 domain-containing protein [Vicinamibacterales bacterium]
MLPASYATPTAILLLVVGLLSCFAGHRLFRFVLGAFGFLIGAFVTSLILGGATATWMLVLAAFIGGIVGALLMWAAYFIGVGLVGAGLAALVVNLIWHAFSGNEPPTVVLVIVCVLGALGALSIVRYVVIFGTALAGSWTLLIGALALAGSPAAKKAVAGGSYWIFYPLDPQPDRWWLLPAWLALSLGGVIVQLSTSRQAVRARGKKPAKV